MQRTRPGPTWAITFAALLMLAALGNAELVKFPLTKLTDVDRTAFIVNLEESIGEPVAVAAIANVDADLDTVRSAAESQGRAAEAAAARIIQLATDAGINVVSHVTYGHVMTGMSLRVATEEDGARLSQLLKADTTVKSVHPVVKYKVDLDRLRSADAEAEAAVAAVTAAAAEPAALVPNIWGGADESTTVDMAQSKYTGSGVRVAVIDDGLDFTHPAFGGCTAINKGTKCRVIAGHDFTDNDDITYDTCGSHGTHVAGIIAGDAMHTGSRAVPWRGVAYEAQLGAYRVFACDGSTTNEWLLAAVERAVRDRMTIINLSMGTSWTAPLGVEFTTRLARQGVMVVAAAGNSGDDGLWTYGAPASEPDSVSVGSTDNTYSLGAALSIDKAVWVRGETTKVLDATARALMGNRMPAVGKALVLPQPRSACSPITNRNAVAGKIVVVPSGECTENDKAIFLLDAGAEGILFYDSRPYPAFRQALNIDEGVGNKHAPQMLSVDQDTGIAVTKSLEAGNTIKLTEIRSKKYLNPNAEKPSWFTSWGPDVEMRMLPTFSAPGGGILSSIPGKNYALYQGTSMATPYATGSLALWREANKNRLGSGRSVLDAAKAAFINTAAPVKVNDDEKWTHSVVVVGAGLIQVKSAIDNKVDVSPSYLALPTGQAETTTTISLTNSGNKPVAYRLAHTPAVAVATDNAWYGKESTEKVAAGVSFRNNADTQDINTISIAPGATEKVKVTITTNDRLRVSPLFYSGYLSLTPIDPARAAALGRKMLQDSYVSALSVAEPAAAADLDFWFPALSIPYLSLSQKYSDLSTVASPRSDVPEGRSLVNGAAYLCSLLDGNCAVSSATEISTDSLTLQLGAITFALPLARPVQSAHIDIYNAYTNALLGRTDTLKGPLAWGGPKALMQLPEMVSGAYWQGEYLPQGQSGPATARLGAGSYRFVIVLQKPVSVGDQAAARINAAAYTEEIEVLGRLVIGSGGVPGWGK